MPWLINAGQLDKFRRSQKNVIVFDASWHLPAAMRDARAEFSKSHIIGARFFDIELFHDQSTDLPNMLSRDEHFIQQGLDALGISNDNKIIFYDNSELHSSCRALWMMKVFGHAPHLLYILDGGYSSWEKYGGKIEVGEPRPPTAKSYEVNFESHFLRTLMQMKTNLHHPAEQVIDLRHPVRFAGGPEHRMHLRSGHIPGSFSFPYFTLFDAEGKFKPVEKIRTQLSGIGVSLHDPIVTTCGSGITSAILNFVLELLGHNENALYDGSWSEWGYEQLYPGESSLADRPVVTSLEK